MIFDESGKEILIKPELLELLEQLRNPMPAVLFRRGSAMFIEACRSFTAPGTVSRERVMQWVISGDGLTDINGAEVIHLNNYLYVDHYAHEWEYPYFRSTYPSAHDGVISQKPTFIATPVDSTPVLVTVTFEIQTTHQNPGVGGRYGYNPNAPPWPFLDIFSAFDSLDVNVTVRSWKLDGTSAPSVSYTWSAVAEGSRADYTFSFR
jgi:hypothetical protein